MVLKFIYGIIGDLILQYKENDIKNKNNVLIVCKNQSTFKIYLNKKCVGEVSGGFNHSWAYEYSLGCGWAISDPVRPNVGNGNWHYINCEIYYAALYNKFLTEEEIKKFSKFNEAFQYDSTITWAGNSLTSTGNQTLTLTNIGDVTITEDGFYFPGSNSAGLLVSLPNEIDLSGPFQIEFDALISGNTNHFGFFRLDSWDINVASIQTNDSILWGQPNSFSCSEQLNINEWNHYIWRRQRQCYTSFNEWSY